MRLLGVSVATLMIAAVALSWASGNDRDIAREITERLKHEQQLGNLRGFDINLKVAEGKVSLKGHVATAKQFELAEEIAAEIGGVQEVENQLTIRGLGDQESAKAQLSEPVVAHVSEAQPAARTADDIARDVTTQLAKEQQAGNLCGFNINLEVAEGTVILTGHVSNKTQFDLAEAAAARVQGVAEVDNQLAMRSAPPAVVVEKLPESIEEVQPQLAATAKPLAPAVEVSAECEPCKTDAEEAGLVKEVALVENAVYEDQPAFEETAALEETASAEEAPAQESLLQQVLSDREIGEELTSRLRLAKEGGALQGFGIGVHVDRGNVWLKGRVTSEEQQQVALDLASRTPGVRQVINGLTVDPQALTAPAADPQSIAQNLGSRLEAADMLGNLAGAHIDAKIDGSTVILRGDVMSPGQAAMAEDLARQVNGVTGVRNELVLLGAPGNPMMNASYLPTHGGLSAPPVGSPGRMPAQGMPISYGPAMGVPLDANATHGPASQPQMSGPMRLASYAGAALAAPIAVMGQMGPCGPTGNCGPWGGASMPASLPGAGHAIQPSRYDNPNLPGYAWPSYAAHPNYAAVTYPKQYSPSAWPYIGPFYPYPQVPLGWRKVTLKWDDGWWNLDFNAR